MSEFKKEFRYLVFKIKDVDLYLTEQEKDSLLCIADELAVCRADAGKNPLQCVVVEDDWPEYDIVWKMIQDRIERKRPEIEDIRSRVTRLEESLKAISTLYWHDAPAPEEMREIARRALEGK